MRVLSPQDANYVPCDTFNELLGSNFSSPLSEALPEIAQQPPLFSIIGGEYHIFRNRPSPTGRQVKLEAIKLSPKWPTIVSDSLTGVNSLRSYWRASWHFRPMSGVTVSGMSWFRRIRRAASVLVLLLCAAYLALFGYDAFQLSKARAMVASLQSIRLGVPLRQQPGATRFHESGCEHDICYAEADISNLPGGENFWRRISLTIPSVLPWKWWTVDAGVKLDSAGKVVEKLLLIDDGKYFQSPTLWLFVGSDPNQFDPCRNAEQIRHPGYRSRRGFRSGALWVNLSANADEQWVRRAFELRLNCLNTVRGCKNPGDIAPAAWQDQIDDEKLADSDFANQARLSNPCAK
jgi:hypothetical protein